MGVVFLVQNSWTVRAISLASGFILAQWVSLAVSVQILMILMLIDMMCGLMLASRRGLLNSKAGTDGVTKKASILIVLVVTYLLQYLVEHQIGAGFSLPVHIGAAVASAYCIIEVVSIIENCHALGAPIPTVLSGVLRRVATLECIELNSSKTGSIKEDANDR